MIDPHDITNFERSEEELEEFLLFAVSVAGKTAEVQAKKLDKFLNLVSLPEKYTPFEKIRYLIVNRFCSLRRYLKKVKLGKYSLLEDSFRSLSFSNVDLRSISCKDLQSFPGIGPKTSRFFILHSRSSAEVACLDTHILKWLSEYLDGVEVPKSTPRNSEYKNLESRFIEICNLNNVHPAKLDLKIWKMYNTNNEEEVDSVF